MRATLRQTEQAEFEKELYAQHEAKAKDQEKRHTSAVQCIVKSEQAIAQAISKITTTEPPTEDLC